MAEEGIRWSCQNGDIDNLKSSIDRPGFDINACIGKRPPLHIAADYGQLSVIEFLVKNGAEVNKKDELGMSALLAAIYENHYDCVEFLLKNGASTNDTAPSGETLLECAEQEKLKELLRKYKK
ncbi:myotrophin-like [Anneissia japonica]|uniref:myotrophin-like n=1 Tax=Anneissia japonica TaxID=1529436 RepID=UPI0014256635|nr:myotrophin-like [Anneissia japonica]